MRAECVQVLSKLVELKQTHIATLTDVVKANDQRQREGADAAPPPAAAVTAAAGLSPITIEQCRRMQHTEIVARWRAYAERMASLLIEAEMPNPTQDCMDRLHEVSACPPLASSLPAGCADDQQSGALRAFRVYCQPRTRAALMCAAHCGHEDRTGQLHSTVGSRTSMRQARAV